MSTEHVNGINNSLEDEVSSRGVSDKANVSALENTPKDNRKRSSMGKHQRKKMKEGKTLDIIQEIEEDQETNCREDRNAEEMQDGKSISISPGKRRAQLETPHLQVNKYKEETREIPQENLNNLVDHIFDSINGIHKSNVAEENLNALKPKKKHAKNIDIQKLVWRPQLTLPEGDGNETLNSFSQKKIMRFVNDSEFSATSNSVSRKLLIEKSGDGAKGIFVERPDEHEKANALKARAPDTAGDKWFGLPATVITEDVKTDLRVLRLRSAYDPKQFYKKFDDSKFPKYFQFGTVIEGPTDWHSGRLSKKQRKQTLAEEIMADDHLTEMRKKRINKMQQESNRWAGRPAGRKTENPRLRKKASRSKH